MRNQITLVLKTVFTIIMAFGFISIVAQNNRISFNNNWGKQGLSVKKQDKSGLVINTSISAYDINPVVVDNKTLVTITTEGVYLQNDAGAPNLPIFSRYIAIPKGAKAVAKVIRKQTTNQANMEISPAPVIPKDNDNTPLIFSKNQEIYSTNEFYPNNIVQLSEPLKIRGMDVVLVGISPFQYNPVTKEMLVNRDIEVEISFEGGTGEFGDDRLRNRWWEPIISDAVINYETVGKPKRNMRSTDQTGFEYLIIVPDDATYISWADSLKNFRNRQGILTTVLTTTEIGGNSISSIENYINDAYNTWDIPPSAVLLMADYGDFGNTIVSPIYDSYCVSDNIFADVDDDQMPDIIFARMTAKNEEHLETYVTKVLNYERTPPVSADFYNHPITALGWQTERWFQICSETVGGFFKTIHGKDPIRINAVYEGNPDVDPWSSASNTNTIINYFGPNGLGYIPGTPSELGGWTGGTSADVTNALNAGAFILQHRDHGNTSGWGEPAYNSNSINGLTNTDLSFIFSINCLTGKYNDPTECFAEKFHRHKYNGQNSGALGLIAASEVSYSFVNDTYVWGMYDNMWPEFLPDYGTNPEPRGILPAFGNAAGKYFLKSSSWPYNTGNKEVTYHLFHHHGDAFSVVYSEVPQHLTVSHDQGILAGEMSFFVSADEGSLIALSVNDVIIGIADGTGAPVEIEIPAQFPPDKILVTVTKQNYYRYESYVDVIPPAGPYVIYNDVAVNNSTGLMTTGELTYIDLTVKNIGVESGNDIEVVISTEDENIEIIDNSDEYGGIGAGATASTTDGFSWNVASDITDMHIVQFDVQATNGSSIWYSKMFITGHAPELSIGRMTFDDSQGGNGNGQLDAGETVDVIIETNNNGSSVANNTVGQLSCASALIDIENNNTAVGNIENHGTLTAIFSITIDDLAPLGSVFEFEYKAVSGEYEAEKIFVKKAGEIVEDWETGDMTKYPWQTGGSTVWEISDIDPFEGTYCNKSSDINDSQSTWMSIIYEASIDDSISFYVMVSSQAQFDFFRFYIDGIPKLTLSGEKPWQRVSFPVSAGAHLFKWQYSKNENYSLGEDCARVDYIILPTPIITSIYAGEDMEYCDSEDMLCEGTASNCEEVLWTTSGSGTFSNPEIMNPDYFASADDIEAGSVELTLTGEGPSIIVEDKVLFTFGKAPVISLGVDGSICSNEIFQISDASVENSLSSKWTSLGDGTFDDPGLINPGYTPGPTDIENGITTLILTAVGIESCGEVSDQIELTIYSVSTANAGSDADICPMLTHTLSDAAASNYESILWTTNGDGIFDDASSAQPTYTPGESDKEIKEVTLTLKASNGSICAEVIDEMLLTLFCTDISEINNKGIISIYPNPNHGSCSLVLDNITNEKANIRIFNSVGKIVFEKAENMINNRFKMNLNLDVTPGIYTVVIEGETTHLSKKFVIK
jgi:peptidase C25-like protein/type IX secretion system substrate protein